MTVFNDLHHIAIPEKQTAIAIGVFDGLHLGHKQVIEKAVIYGREQQMIPTVFSFDFSGSSLPQGKNIQERIYSPSLFVHQLELLGVEQVLVIPFDQLRELEPDEFIKRVLKDQVNCGFISCGEDFRFGKDAKGNCEVLKKWQKTYQMQVESLPLVMHRGEVISSTAIRECIKEGNMKEANEMLGHRYALDFPVVEGNRIGRTLGAPTINQPFPQGYVLPKYGVYATITLVDGVWHTSVTNIGTKPTIGIYDASSETYIQNYSGNLYGKQVLVEFLDFVRPEMRFESMQDLRDAIAKDSETAYTIGKDIVNELNQ